MINRQASLSEKLSCFLNEMEQAKKDYEWAIQEEIKMEKLTQDYLHMLEFGKLDYHDRARIAKSISACRISRRKSKDIIAITEPIVEFLSGEKGKVLISQLQQILGKVRKEEKMMQQRTYTPKVLSQEEFESQQHAQGRGIW